MTDLTYVSLFSGIEAFSVAASRIADVDWRPVFFSEIEPFPCAVLAHHFPSVPNLGDICNIRVDREKGTITNGETTIPLPGTGIDILAGGSPCQDVSVAGKRAGMSEGSGTRSSLAFEYARLVAELRPRVILWENVPGVLSANGGRDFAAFLHTLDELGYSLAWRVLDCQYTRVDSAPRAVPQRRRRVWLVGCLGGDGRVPAQILFERAGLLGDTPPRSEAGQGFAAPAGYGPARNDRLVAGEGFGETGQGFWQPGVQSLRADHQGANWPSNVAVTPCRTGAGADRGGRGNDAGKGAETGTYGNVAETLDASYYKGQGARDGRERALAIVPSASFDGADVSAMMVSVDHKASCDGENVALTLLSTTGGFKPGAVATFENHGQDSRVRPTDVSDTRSGKDGTGGNNLPLVCTEPAVCKTLSAEGFDGMPDVQKGNGQPIVTIGFCPEESAKTRSIGAHDETSPTLNSSSIRATAIGFKPGQSGRKDTGSLGARMEESPTLPRDPGGMGVGVAVGFSHVASGAMLDCQPKPCATPLKRSPGGEGAVAIGVSFDGRKDAPVIEECAHTQCVGTNPGFKNGVATMLKIRCGKDTYIKPDGSIGTAGKCPLVSEESAFTISATQDQTLILNYIVRRLTPVECERLQGFPDGWTIIPYRGKPASECPDSPRYKALGNSWATNCAEWVLRRIVAAIRLGMVAPNGGPRP